MLTADNRHAFISLF